jgi:SAM-dependent methyltransferase
MPGSENKQTEIAMHEDRLRWNRKYAEKTYPDYPTDLVVTWLPRARTGRALDIAAGNGRNAVYLAERGYRVDAVDISDAGLRLFAGRHPRVRPICADLDRYEVRPDRYDLIINIKYLNRRLFPTIAEGLRPHGLLLFETYVKAAGNLPDQPFRDEHLLRENELLRAFLSLKIIYYHEAAEPLHSDPYPLASLAALKK